MSGVGEILAIVSCVAGLIQAYDAGSRVVKQIKQRRQARGALPPSDLLEESIEKGRNEITKMVEDGNKRFGPRFEEGDSEPSPRAPEFMQPKLTCFTAIAQMALMRVTIATQQALLAGLTQAREDDGIIDFDDCIDTSDKGRNEALLALHALFQRKLEEDMQRKKVVAEQTQRPADIPKDSKPPPYQPEATPSDSSRPPASTNPTKPDPATNSNTNPKKSKTFSEVFRRKTSSENPPKQPSTNFASNGLTQQAAPRHSQQEIAHPNTVTRRNTNNSITSDATWSSGSSGTSDATLGRPRSIGRPNSIASSVGSPDRRNTTMSTISSMSSMSGMTAVSAVSSMSSMSTSPHIAKYGGCCKYAYELRDGNVKKALMLQVMGHYGAGGGSFVCSSSKCEFSGPALKERWGYKMHDKVLIAPRRGLRYHWLFLAKSHVQQLDSRYASYRCLPCLLSKEDSVLYHDEAEFFEHLAEHQGTYLGNTILEGRLKFTNHGAVACADSDFDLEYPEPTPVASVGTSDKEIAVVVSANVPSERSKPEEGRVPPPRTAYTYDEQPDDNPWL